MATNRMTDDANCGPSYSDGPDTERYAQFLDDAPGWLHYEKACIDRLTRSEVNHLARQEIGRRDYDGPIEDDPRAIWAWLFVEYVLYRDEDRAGYADGDADD
ncbi:hypothetical protein DMJ13_03555 [halophilic archaeon]|nr:hypothetical protein DMJ13_03555 [halophilic archaeon]